MSQGKSQTKSVETASVEAVNIVSDEATRLTFAHHSAAAGEEGSLLRDERPDVARPKLAGKRRGTSDAVTGISAQSDDGKVKPAKKPARTTGAAASKDKSEFKAEADPATAAAPSKLDRLVTLLRAPGGATLPELQAATGWQVHSVRGAMAGTLRKKGYSITSEKPEDGLRCYRIAEAS